MGNLEYKVIIDANSYIKDLKEMQSELEEFRAIADFEKNKIQESFELKKDRIEGKIKYIKEQIYLCCQSMEMKETKTQKKKTLLDGEIIIKKETEKMVVDKEKLMKWTKKNRPEFVEEVKTQTLKWAELKKELKIIDDCVIDVTTGECVGEGIGITKEPEILKIEF